MACLANAPVIYTDLQSSTQMELDDIVKVVNGIE